MADILDKDLVGIVGSIFATSPEAMKIARERADLSRAQAIANAEAQQMGGGTALSANLMGGQAVRQLGGLLGVEDPMMQRESAKRQLATGLDMSSPEAVLEYARRLADAGLQQESAQAMMAARAMQEQTQRIATSRAQQVRAEREPGQVNIQQIVSSGKYTPASVAKYQQTQNPADLVLIKEVGAGAGVSKPLPASLQKDEGKDLEAYDSYSAQKEALMPSIVNLTPDAEGVRKLELGPLKNAKYAAQNIAGNSTPESRAYEGLKSAVDTAVNLQVSAEKGVQTDKDVLRFANALIAAYGRNDTQATLEALKRYYDSVNRAQQKTAGRIESRRKSQNVEPYFQGQEQPTTSAAPKTKRTKTLASGLVVEIED